MTPYKTQYIIAGLPKSWAGVSFETSGVSKLKTDKLKQALHNIPHDVGSTVVTSGNIAPIIDYIVKSFGISSVEGINFLDLVDEKLGKKEDILYPVGRRFVVIYNVGLETMVSNYKFPSKVLQQCIKKYHNKNCCVFIQTVWSKADIERNYDITFSNHVSIPEKPEVTFI